MSEDPLEKPRRLQERIKEEAAKLGLDLVNFMVRPGTNNDRVMVLFQIKPDAIKTPEEKAADEEKAAFEKMMAQEFKPEPKSNLKDFLDGT